MCYNLGRTHSIYEAAQIVVGTAFPLAFRNSNILSGFAASDISPLNKDIFPDDYFLSCLTDRPEPTVAQKSLPNQNCMQLHNLFTTGLHFHQAAEMKPQFHQI
jgi:hypothetical protein